MNSALDRSTRSRIGPRIAGWSAALGARLPGRLRELWAYRELTYNLVVRNLKVRYKNSVLGIFWSLLNPLLMMMVFTIMFRVLWNNSGVRLFHLFVLTGILPWNFFSGAVVESIHSVVGNGHLVKKVYFPREVLPISTVLSQLVHFLLALLVLVPILFISGVGLTWHALWLPLIIATQVIFILGLAFFLSTLNVYYRDTAMIMDVGMMAWFFLTPVFWPVEWLPPSRLILGMTVDVHRLVRWLNPMASIVDSYRTVLYGSAAGAGPSEPALDFLLRTFITALVLCLAGWWFFARKSREFGEEI